MQFLILSYDGTDPDAPARRLAVRQAHLARINVARDAGQFIEGGAILDDNSQMIGSACIVQFDSREELDQWLLDEPYLTGEVWQKTEIVPFRCAPKP